MKKLLLIAAVALGLGFAAAPRSEAGVQVGIGIGLPVVGFGYGYPGYYGPVTTAPATTHTDMDTAPYGYYGSGVRVVAGPRYYWHHGQRVYYTRHRHLH